MKFKVIKVLSIAWVVSLLMCVLLFFDQITGVETENAEGSVVSVVGSVTGQYCWPLLKFFGSILLVSTLVILIVMFANSIREFGKSNRK